jgi:hypothetical protein
VAVDDHFLFFAQEARTYALVQVAAVGHVYLFSRLLTHPTAGCRLGWIASGVLLFHLHYTTALVVAAEIACYGILRGLTRYRPSYSPTSLLVDVGAWILLCAPASNHLLQIAERRSNWKSFVHDRPPWAILTIFPLPTYLAVPALFVASSWALRQAGSRRSFLLWRNGGERQAEQLGSPNQKRLPTHSAQPATTLLLTCCWLFVPLCLAWLSTRTDVARLFFRRYLMASSPAPALLAALIGNRASQGMALPVCAITLGVAVFTMGPFHRLARPGPWLRHSREDWRAAIRHVNESGEQDQVPVFLRSGLIEADQWYDAEDDLLRTYCLLPVRGIYKLAPRYQHIIPLPTTNSGSLSREHIALIAGQGGAWLVLRGRKQTADDIERQVLARLGAWRGRVVQRREFGNVTVVRLSDE